MVIGLILVVTLGPFVDKAIHTDDVLFVRAGQWIQKHPVDFFGGRINWWMSAIPMSAANCNPPMLSYLLAGVASVFGWNEIVLHLAAFGVAWLTALGIYSLARMWCERPLLATLVAVFTPAFLVSSTTLMCDVMMLGLWVWALVLWERALAGGRPCWQQFAGAGMLAGLALLTKYSAIVLLPLLPVLSISRTRRRGWWLVGAILPVLMLAVYELITARMYGRGLFSAAVHYAHSERIEFSGGWRASRIIDLAFAGGSILPLLFFAPWLWRRSALLAGSLLVPGVMLIVFRIWKDVALDSDAPGLMNNWRFLAQLILMTASAVHFLLLVTAEAWHGRDIVTRVLVLWIAAVLCFATVLNWTVNVRSFLPLVPAAAILAVRRLERFRTESLKEGRSLWPLIPAAALALGIATADYQLAGSARTAAAQITTKYKSTDHTLWFEGHGGFQYYMEKLGARPVDAKQTVFQPGDIVVVPEVGIIVPMPPETVGWIEPLAYASSKWIRITGGDKDGKAGFYTANMGPLPFAFGKPLFQNYIILKAFSRVQYTSSAADRQEAQAGQVPDFPKISWITHPRPVYSLSPEVAQRIRAARQLAVQGNTETAIQQYRELLKPDFNNPAALTDLAWILSTTEKPELRNGGVAVQLAGRAVGLTDFRQIQSIQVLAAAYAEAGRFPVAVEVSHIAATLAYLTGQSEIAAYNRKMMGLYSTGKTIASMRPIAGNIPVVPDPGDTPRQER
jgi:hypothetical protein